MKGWHGNRQVTTIKEVCKLRCIHFKRLLSIFVHRCISGMQMWLLGPPMPYGCIYSRQWKDILGRCCFIIKPSAYQSSMVIVRHFCLRNLLGIRTILWLYNRITVIQMNHFSCLVALCQINNSKFRYSILLMIIILFSLPFHFRTCLQSSVNPLLSIVIPTLITTNGPSFLSSNWYVPFLHIATSLKHFWGGTKFTVICVVIVVLPVFAHTILDLRRNEYAETIIHLFSCMIINNHEQFKWILHRLVSMRASSEAYHYMVYNQNGNSSRCLCDHVISLLFLSIHTHHVYSRVETNKRSCPFSAFICWLNIGS